MGANAFEILALAMRYVFAGLMLLIVLRAWRITAIDSRRARKLRRLSPDTGVVGEMLVVEGGERARTGMRYPVTLEGTMGSGRRADVRVRHSSVRSRHAFYQMTREGLFVRGHASARLRDGAGRAARELTLGDGDVLQLGAVKMMLVLSDGGDAPDEMNRHVLRRRPERSGKDADAPDDGLFDAPDEMNRRVLRRRPERSGEDADAPDDGFFDAPDSPESEIDDLFMSNPAARREDPYDEFQ